MIMYVWTNNGRDNLWSNTNNWLNYNTQKNGDGVPGINSSSSSADFVRFIDIPNTPTMNVKVDKQNLSPFYTVQFESSKTSYTILGNESLPIGTQLISDGTGTNTISCPLKISNSVSVEIMNGGQINLTGVITSSVPEDYMYVDLGILNISGAAKVFCGQIILGSGGTINGC